MRKTLFYALSALLWGACFSIVALVWLEHLGGYDLLKGGGKSSKDKFEIHHSAYYGQPLDGNPYEAFAIQHLHPFYMFSLPWTAKDIAEANTAIISLNARGFRNSFSNGAARRGVILGGSTAFGSHASSDDTTLASALNRLQTNYDFLNYGVPSWNSHQETVAYTKIPFETDFVIAFTGANDFSIAAHYCRKGYDFPLGSPESFEYLAAITDDIRGERKDGGFLSGLFPRTQKKVSKLLAKISGPEIGRPDCHADILGAADAFIANQRVVRDLAVARGGTYLMVLQPHIDFLKTPDEKRIEAAKLRRAFYRYVAESEFCRTSNCLDLSRMFDGTEPLYVNETPKNPNKAIFADKVHLTDHGYALVAERLNLVIRR